MKIISFNSYKGGACRTTTCYNILPYLAKELGATAEQPIIVVDCDLDSMGLTSIFHANVKSDGRKGRLPYSAKHLFVDDGYGINSKLSNTRFTDVRQDEYFKNFEKVGEKLGLEDDGSVLFLGVDDKERTISDNDYADKETFCESAPARKLVTLLGKMDEGKKPKAVVFDCASGVQMTTLAVFMLIDYSVMCMRPTLQFRIGTRDYLYSMLPNHMSNSRRRNRERKILLLPTSVAKATESEELEDLRTKTIRTIRNDIVNFIINESDDVEFGYTLIPYMTEVNCFGLPEIERFKWEECLLYKAAQLTPQEEALRDRYMKVASILAGNYGE